MNARLVLIYYKVHIVPWRRFRTFVNVILYLRYMPRSFRLEKGGFFCLNKIEYPSLKDVLHKTDIS